MNNQRTFLLKSLTQKLIRSAGGVEAGARICGLSPASMSNAASTDKDLFLNINSLIELTNVAGDASLLNFINDCCDQTQSSDQARSTRAMLLALSNLHKEAADFTAVAAEALADDKVTKTEAKKMLKEGHELMDAIKHACDIIGALGGVEITSEMESHT